jgi:tRNA1(Val) A37 N6-methylase TrmN6
MTTVNPYPTFNYAQPEDYRFSHDSVFLARKVFEQITQDHIVDKNTLDLCAGCGIVGLDFLYHCRAEFSVGPATMDFLEVQSIYRSYFQANIERLGVINTRTRFLHQNYEQLGQPEFADQYDLVVCNPPYFFPGMGLLSPSQFKNRCRFFIDSDFANLLKALRVTLKTNGMAFLLLRDLPEHRWNALEQCQQLLQGTLNLVLLGEIRGTHFVRLTKVSNTV